MDCVVATRHGELLGSTHRGVSKFLGIPYGAAPFEGWRLLPPVPVRPWSGRRDATHFGPTVLKTPYGWPYSELLVEPDLPGDECLNLNVWTPDPSGSAPVLVWIHGGAFANGSGAVPQYDGSAFARDGVVCVTLNYRLGADGFLDTGDEHTNIGLQDQLAALGWVSDNIAQFGGDPARVTVAGQSAGAMSIGALLASPSSRGLFQNAIMQSGAAHHAIPRSTAQAVAAQLAEQLGIVATRKAFADVPVPDLLAAQTAFALEIQAGGDPVRWGDVARSMMPFQPVIDGTMVPALPVESIRAGAGSDVRVLIGTNTDENRLFLAPSGAIDYIDESLLAAAVAGYGFTDIDAIVALYRDDAEPAPGNTLAAIATDWFFRIPAIRLAEARGNDAAPVYMYEFGWRSTAREGVLGACHSLELPFVFDTLESDGADWLTGASAPQSLADEMHSAWVRFVKEGDPGWTPYSPDSRTVQVFDTPSVTTDDPRGERRESWQGLR
jgi:para-nitrobenzyl esterase